MKYFLIAILFGICLFVGFLVSNKYRQRSAFFKALVLVCQKLNVEISFSRERLKNLVGSFDQQTKKSLCGLADNYLAFIEQESPLDKESLFKNIKFLKEDEKDIIFLFFRSLGRSDVDSQSKELSNFEKRFESLVTSSAEENKKYGKLSFKLGIMAGLLIVIVLI